MAFWVIVTLVVDEINFVADSRIVHVSLGRPSIFRKSGPLSRLKYSLIAGLYTSKLNSADL